MLRGNWRGQILGSGSDVWKYWTERRAGTLDECSWREMEDGIARSFGTCMTMGTASTMAAAVDALGLTLPGASSIPAADSAHPRMATAAGRRIVEMVWEDLQAARHPDDRGVRERRHGGDGARRIDQRHHPSRSRWPDAPGAALDLDRFDALSRRTPFLANIRPSGKFLMEDFYYAGGLRGAAAIGCGDLLHIDCLTVNGRTLGENLADAVVSNDEVIVPRETAARARRRAWRCCAATSRPTAPSSSTPPPIAGCSSTPDRRSCSATTTTWTRGSTIRRCR